MTQPNHRRNLIWLSLYGMAMGYVEAVIVVYLRLLYYPENPLEIFPPRLLSPAHLRMELLRECATILMILTVAMISSRGFVRGFATFVYVFGVWDIFYYLCLKLTIGWPVSWAEWDILFLIPWVWLGPWPTAVLISSLFVAWGAWILWSAVEYRARPVPLALFTAGALLAVWAFLEPGSAYLRAEAESFATYRPGRFAWWVYVPGLGLMAGALLLTLSSGRSPSR